MQWLVCQLHGNELSLRHLMQHLDGLTHGPHAVSCPIGKVVSRCEQLPVTTFENIEVALPIVNVNELSTNQQYLWEITNAVSNGYCPQALPRREPGAVSWCTQSLKMVDHRIWTVAIICLYRRSIRMFESSCTLRC